MLRSKRTQLAAASVIAAGTLLGAGAALAGGLGGFNTREAPMLSADTPNTSGTFSVDPVLTVGEELPSGTDRNAQKLGYTIPGVLDGLGATQLDDKVVRVFVNHEFGFGVGFPYELANGTQLTGARISYVDINRNTRKAIHGELAYQTMYARDGSVVDSVSDLDYPGLNRLCSGSFYEAEQFGPGNGFADAMYITNEESSSRFDGPGGSYWALDPANGDLWALPSLGRGAWENLTQLDAGRTDTVALMLADDFGTRDSSFDVNPAPPLYLYIGQKDASGDFLARNGLRDGRLFVWISDDGDKDPRDFNGTGSMRVGRWLEFTDINFRTDLVGADAAALDTDGNEDTGIGVPRGDGQFVGADYTPDGYAVDSTLRIAGRDAGAFLLSRPEDIATDPADGTRAVIASTGRERLFDGADIWGTTYIFDVDFAFDEKGEFDPAASTTTAEIIYDGNETGDFGLRSPDNLDWADNGLVYVQEDRAISSSLFGQSSGAEASVWKLNPNTYQATRVLEMDRSAVPFGQTDTDPDDLGDWESSGIIDVTSLFPTSEGERLFLLDVQAHAIREGAIIQGEDGDRNTSLVEGGQLMFASEPE